MESIVDRGSTPLISTNGVSFQTNRTVLIQNRLYVNSWGCKTQTESRLESDKVNTEKKSCDTHNKIGKIVRRSIKQARRHYARRFTNN